MTSGEHSIAQALPAGRQGWLGLVLELTKLQISAVSTLSAATGYIAFRRGVDWGLVTAVAGTLLLAMAASALNEVQEWRTDALMARTARRPIPRGAVTAGTVTVLAAVLAVGGFLLLLLVHGWAPALLGLLAMVWYNALYTPLKRVSAFAVVPGSVIGALPPAIGWAAAGGHLDAPAILALCFLFFIWQVPHFWLLALLHRADYRQAGLPTLHRHFSEAQILRLIFTWTCGTAAACVLLPAFGTTGGYGAAFLLAAGAVWLVLKFKSLIGPGQGPAQFRKAFMNINFFLLLVMAAVVLDVIMV